MARHRLRPQIPEQATDSGSVDTEPFTVLEQICRTPVARTSVRVRRASILTIATITPLVLASAVGGQSRVIGVHTKAPVATPVIEAAVVSPASNDELGPAVVVVAERHDTLHVLSTPMQSPPASVTSIATHGIPSMALAAYLNAEKNMAVADPQCGISWNLLAGIGRIESGHARDATDARGTAVRPIYGPPLRGTLPENEVVAQSVDRGRVIYARAVGPMQFLPGTWERYAADGNGDGVADPQNLYDATLAAARYLCSGGLNLRDPSQTMTAILRYNNSMSYARNVLGWAAAYASGVAPKDLPPVQGAAPPLGDSHLESQRGLGPGLPLDVHGLPTSDPLTQAPIIDLGQALSPSQQLPVTSQTPDSTPPNGCTLICIGR